VFTFAHFPVITGIVLFAVAAKKTVAHPADPLSGAGRFSLGVGIALVLLGLTFGRWRVVRTLAVGRLVTAVAVVVVTLVLADLAAAGVLAVGVATFACHTAWESRRFRPRLLGGVESET
jgi:low temperature requirement protein LtrA